MRSHHRNPGRSARLRLPVLACCLLCLSASCDLDVLATVIEPTLCCRIVDCGVSQQASSFEDEEEIFRPADPDAGGALERKLARPQTPPEGWAEVHPLIPAPAPLPRPDPSRAGCEHAWRNGLGVPLLC
jgi:hypothetical protein